MAYERIEIAPSVLAADFARLGEEILAVETGGADLIHFDVMDGHFVPNLTIGIPVLESLRKATRLPIDVHLMIENPEMYIDAFVRAGGNRVLVHQEATVHLDRALAMIREAGAEAGAVINPATPVATLDEVLDIVDYVLVMSVNPGFGGQRFIPKALEKVGQLSRKKRERGLQFPIEIDGGVTKENVADVAHAGVEWIVAGSSVFHTVNPAAAFEEMQQLARIGSAVRV